MEDPIATAKHSVAVATVTYLVNDSRKSAPSVKEDGGDGGH